MPRSRNTRIRAKDTSRADARRRHRDEQRELETVEDDAEATLAEAQPQQRPSSFQLPNVLDDLKHLREVFGSKWVWVPFGLLALTLVLSVALIYGALDGLPAPVPDILALYISLTLGPQSLFIYFIGGFVAPRGSYLVGGILGVLSGLINVIVWSLVTDLAKETADVLTASTGGAIPEITADFVLQSIGMGFFVGVFAGGFAAWYRRFLRSSQERAAANRAAREREQAEKAREQARADRAQVRADKYAAREAKRKGSR